MIGRLRGELLEVSGGMVVVDAGGVGYEVILPDSVLLQMPPVGEQVNLYTRQIFREDSVTLYGFIESFDRRMFDLLIGVNGCGPRIGIALIGQLGGQAVLHGIVTQDAKALTRANGVGPKLAERIIVELKGKMAEESLALKVEGATRGKAVVSVHVDSELVDALLALGYRRTEAEAAARDAEESGGSIQDQLKVALRSLAR
ncbi:MAG: Holliday junction branch migration protein RuvA [Fimbriimonadaceae bacterium]|nr:Holliday junction branch migration protein RuvA [Fimbriimonadaceae bacterium]